MSRSPCTSAMTRRPALRLTGLDPRRGRVHGDRPARARPARSSRSSASRAPGRASSSARSPGSNAATGQIEIGRRSGARAWPAGTSLVSADRQTSLFANLTIGRQHGVAPRSGDHDRRHRPATAADGPYRDTSCAIDSGSRPSSIHLPIRSLVRRQPAEGRDRRGHREAPGGARPRGTDAGRRHRLEARDLPAHARSTPTDGHAVIIYCTEVPEVFETADLAYVVSDGRLSDPLLVTTYPGRRGAGQGGHAPRATRRDAAGHAGARGVIRHLRVGPPSPPADRRVAGRASGRVDRRVASAGCSRRRDPSGTRCGRLDRGRSADPSACR